MNPHNIPDLKEFRHKTDLQIRFSDVDVLGHVNNTVYMAFYDTGKARYFTEMLRRPIRWDKVETVIANVDCAFIAPIFFGERIAVHSKVSSVSERSFKLLQVIADDSGAVKSACETVMVCFDPTTQESAPMPEHWREALDREIISQKSEL